MRESPNATASGTGFGRRDVLWVGGLLLLLIAQWASLLFSDRTFYFRDLFFFFQPLLAETAQQWAAGAFPAWNPHLACGAPLAADPNAGVFFPDAWIVPLFGAGVSGVKVLLLWRLFALPLATYAALRIAGLSRRSAFLGAAMASLSGPVALTLSSFPPQLAGSILFLPLAALGFVLSDRSRGAAAVAALLFGLIVLAGSPEVIVQSAIVFGICSCQRPLMRSVRRCAFVIVTGACLASVQWLPALRLFPRTPRALGAPLSTPPGFLSFPPVRLLEFVWPGLLGDPLSDSPWSYWGRSLTDGVTPYLLSISAGLVTLVLVPIALRNRLGRRLAMTAASFLFLSFGRFLPGGAALSQLPILRILRYPEKWLIGAVLALVAVAAVGLEELRSGRPVPRSRALVLPGVLAALSAALWLFALLAPVREVRGLQEVGVVDGRLPRSADARVAGTIGTEGAVGLVVSVCAGILLSTRREALARRMPSLLIALAFLERFPCVAGRVPTLPGGFFRDSAEKAQLVRQHSGDARFFYDREATVSLDALRPFTGTLFGLSYAGNTDIDQFSDVRSRAFAERLQNMFFSDPRKAALLRLANVRVVDTDDPAAENAGGKVIGKAYGERFLYELEGNRAERLFFHAVKAADSRQALAYTMARGLPTESVAVVEGMESFQGSAAASSVGALQSEGPRRFRLAVETEAPALLQLAITFDPGWKVFVDGGSQATVPVDSVFLGVFLSAGKHEVRGVFRDPSFLVGGALSLVALGFLILWPRSRVKKSG